MIGEYVDGQFEYYNRDQTIPIESDYSYLGYGTFNITQGRWDTLTLIAYLAGKVLSENESMMVCSLRYSLPETLYF